MISTVTLYYMYSIQIFPNISLPHKGCSLNEINAHKAVIPPKKIFLMNNSKPGVPELDFEVIKKCRCILKAF